MIPFVCIWCDPSYETLGPELRTCHHCRNHVNECCPECECDVCYRERHGDDDLVLGERLDVPPL